jgi:methionine-rich copper-binding protein CopC
VKTRSSACRLAALFGLSVVWLFLSCTPALAHATLTEAYPADGAALSESPEQVQLLFNEPIEADFDPLKVYDRGSDRVDEDNARVSPNNAKLLVVDLEGLPEGSYMVEWRVTSADGHPVSGTQRFVVDPSAPGGVGEPLAPIERTTQQEETGGWFSHIFHFAGLGLAVLIVLVLALLRKTKGITG